MTIYTVTKVRYLEGYDRTQELLGVALTNRKAHHIAWPHTNPTGSNPLSIIEDLKGSEELDADGFEHILIQDWEAE